MRKNYCIESIENFDGKDHYIMFFRGWYVPENGEDPYVKLLADGKECIERIDHVRRLDVTALFPNAAPNRSYGFLAKCVIPKDTRKLNLVIDGQEILKLNESEIRRSAISNPLIYEFTLAQENDHAYRITGYAFNVDGTAPEIEIEDKEGSARSIKTDRLEGLSAPYYFRSADQVRGFTIVIETHKPFENFSIVFRNRNGDLKIPLKMHFNRVEILYNNLQIMGFEKIYPLWKANGSRFIARRLFRQNLFNAFDRIDEGKWYQENRPTEEELNRQRETVFGYQPKISIVTAAYNTDFDLFDGLMDSLKNQTYSNWEICVADGSNNTSLKEYVEEKYADFPQLRYRYLNENLGISGNTNKAIEIADGDYIGFIDHDDTIREDTFYEVVRALNQKRYPFIYSDEDKLITKDGALAYPAFKPDYSPDFLISNNYISHFSIISRELLDQIGYLRPEFDGSQDYDLVLRVAAAVDPADIYHIPKPLYHWRIIEGSTAMDPNAKLWAYEAGRRAVADYVKNHTPGGTVRNGDFLGSYYVDYDVVGNQLVSIIIPNKDHTEDLEKLLSSLQAKNTYKNIEILIVENNSEKEETFGYYEEALRKYSDLNLKILTWKDEFNYSAINNFAAKKAQGEYLLLLNNDMEVIDGDFIHGMLGNAQRKEAGAVGIMLLYEDGTIQHDGILWGAEGGYHLYHHDEPHGMSYCHTKILQHNVAGVTGACLMVDKKKYFEVGGLDPVFRVGYNDVDFCLKLLKAGYYNIILPQYKMYHYESLSRGFDNTAEKNQRFYAELDLLTDRWDGFFDHGDPFYNPNMSLTRGFYNPRLKSELLDYQSLRNVKANRKKERERLLKQQARENNE